MFPVLDPTVVHKFTLFLYYDELASWEFVYTPEEREEWRDIRNEVGRSLIQYASRRGYFS